MQASKIPFYVLSQASRSGTKDLIEGNQKYGITLKYLDEPCISKASGEMLHSSSLGIHLMVCVWSLRPDVASQAKYDKPFQQIQLIGRVPIKVTIAMSALQNLIHSCVKAAMEAVG
ncbi:hypothetical protein Tco_0636739 [Tanacetum coccineum]